MRVDSSAPSRRVLIIDEDEALQQALGVLLAKEGYETRATATLNQGLSELERQPAEFVLVELRSASISGLSVVDDVRRRVPRALVLCLATNPAPELVLEAVRRGAQDYLIKPFRPEEVLLAVRKAEERERQMRRSAPLDERMTPRAVAAVVAQNRPATELVTLSQRMQEILHVVRKISDFKTTVLVTGESGTGKEMIARVLHETSARRSGPFVAVNCCAIPETLLESELFGHRKGAFTDAHRDKPGRFEEASGGTLFLDEIGDLPLTLQVKLLRALQEQEIRPLGSTSDLKVDVRVVAATVRNLQDDVAAGRFREDLYYRLNVLPIQLPPLRERKEEIAPLIERFIKRNNQKLGTHVNGITPEAMRALLAHHWPGNVRELENTIERAMVLAEGELVSLEVLPERLRNPRGRLFPASSGAHLSIKRATRDIEEQLIRRALQETRGNRTNAAKILEISHRALLYKIKDYGIHDL